MRPEGLPAKKPLPPQAKGERGKPTKVTDAPKVEGLGDLVEYPSGLRTRRKATPRVRSRIT